MEHRYTPAGWSGSVQEFLQTPPDRWAEALASHHQRCMLMPADRSQTEAWNQCYRDLQQALPPIVQQNRDAADWFVAFEYELPRERGRRPDVVLLCGSHIVVLEFKGATQATAAHVDQVSAYARDLASYHEGSHDRPIHPVLVLAGNRAESDTWGPVRITSAGNLGEALLGILPDDCGPQILGAEWLNAPYAPLPSLVAAARMIFDHEPLPHIRRAYSAGIPEALESLLDAARQASSRHEQHLALVTGVPGAGKTLVGLQFVYSSYFAADGSKPAVFLSGNGPLVKVLQHALRSGVFVQDVHGFLKQYGGAGNRTLPTEHVWVYDEAQRAWDGDRVREKRGHGASEPQDFLRIGERMDDWALMVGLVGEGQEIHLGEEAGLQQWDEAIRTSKKPWIVHCPSRIAALFPSASAVVVEDTLDLNTTLRSHLAEDIHLWVRRLLEGDLQACSTLAAGITSQGFAMYLVRDQDLAYRYVRDRYLGQIDNRYGILASSKAKNLPSLGIRNDYSFTKNLREGPWYNDPPDSRASCCQLHDVATEFACQGLELDFPVVCWGDDLRWSGGKWVSPVQLRSRARDPHQLRLNSYRVLLTRGRDGFVVFVPDEPAMTTTYDALCAAGVQPLADGDR